MKRCPVCGETWAFVVNYRVRSFWIFWTKRYKVDGCLRCGFEEWHEVLLQDSP